MAAAAKTDISASGSPTKEMVEVNNSTSADDNNNFEDELRAPMVNFVELYKGYCAEAKCRVNSAVTRLLDQHPHRPLTKLPLGNNYVGPKGFQPILRLIVKCQALEEIDLSGNGLTNDCMLDLCKVLTDQHLGCQKLDVSHNSITLEGGKQLMALLETNRRIISLKVDGTDIFESLSKRLEMAADDNYRVTTGREPDARPSKPILSARPTVRPASSAARPVVHLVPASPARNQQIDTTSAAPPPPARPSTGGPVSSAGIERASSANNASRTSSPRKPGSASSTLKPRPPNPALASAQSSRLSDQQREELRERYKQRAETYKNVELATAKQAAAHVRKELAMLEAAEKLSEERKLKSQQERVSPNKVGVSNNNGLEGSPAKPFGRGDDEKNISSQPPQAPPRSALNTHESSPDKKHVHMSEETPNNNNDTPTAAAAHNTRPIPKAPTGPPPAEKDGLKAEGSSGSPLILAGTARNIDAGGALEVSSSLDSPVPREEKVAGQKDEPPLNPTGPSQLVLGVEHQFQALFDLGSKYYGQRKLDEAHTAWTEAMAIAVEQKKREWMSIMHQNLQRLSYEVLTAEGARQLAEGNLDEADKQFDLASDVASKARNASWESEMQRAKKNVLHLKVQTAHDRATQLFENCCNHRRVMVAPERDRYEHDGTMYTNSEAFVNEWPRMLLLKEALEEWAKGWQTTKRILGSNARVLQDLIQSSVGNVTAHILTRYFTVEGSSFGTLALLRVTDMSGYERRQLKRLWEELQSQATRLESLQWEVVSSAMIGHLELSLYQLPRALAKFDATVLAAEELADDCLIAFGLLSKGLVYYQRSHYSESEKNLRMADARLNIVRSKCVENSHHTNSPPGTSDWVSLSYAAHLQSLTQSYLVAVVMGSNRTREALELLEQQKLHQHIDLLREKLVANFTPHPSCHHIQAVAKSSQGPIVYYFEAYRHEWSINADEYESEEKLYIWVVPGEGEVRAAVVEVTKDEKIEKISSLVDDLRRKLYIDTSAAEGDQAMTLALPTTPWKQPLKQLYKILLDPIISFLKIQSAYNELGTFTVVPCGCLWLVPFHALIDTDDEFLAKSFAVTHAFSATQLAFSTLSAIRVMERGLTKAVVMGEPTDSTANIIGGLPFAADAQRSSREVAVMEERLRADIAPITESPELQEAITHARLLHISASIGGTDRKGTSFGGIACETSYKQTGLLHASEISSYDFHAELVTATNSNVIPSPTLDRTDGALSTTRALLTAGCSSIVLGQWCTPDMTPSDFVVSFYQWATREPHKSKALARAIQQRMRKGDKAGGEFTDLSPRHWAGYMVIGAPLLK